MGKIADSFGRMPAGDSLRLALGELVDTDGMIPTWRARDAFMLTLHSLIPDFEDHCHDASYLMLDAWVRADDPNYRDDLAEPIAEGLLRRVGWDYDRALGPYESVLVWATILNLNVEWFLQTIGFRAIDAILAEGRGEGSVTEGVMVRAGISEEQIRRYVASVVEAPGPHLHLTFGGKPVGPKPDETYWSMQVFDPDEEFDFEWNPWLESRANNEKRAMAWFRARYRAAQDAREKEAGGRRAGRKGKPLAHFEWAVRYQVMGDTFTEIASDVDRELQTVIDAVRSVLDLIGLEERERVRPGR